MFFQMGVQSYAFFCKWTNIFDKISKKHPHNNCKGVFDMKNV